MADIIPFRASAASNDVIQSIPQDSEIAAFQARCFDRFKARNVARGLAVQYSNKCVEAMQGLLTWCATPLAALEESDYEAWCGHLANDRHLRRSTQRTYQKGVRQVIKYLHGTADLQNEAQRLFGQRLTLFAHPGNSIVHTTVDETAGRLPPMSHEDIATLFDSIDAQIEIAFNEAPREVRALCRDKAVFHVMYVYGLRVSEVGALEFDDWRADPGLPECGDYAYLNVRHGKGARGSGKRHRIVPTTDVTLVETLLWYRQDVFPQYQARTGNERAVFLSEQGKALSASSISSRLKLHLERAGFNTGKFTPHSLRRSMVTHDIMRVGSEFAREKAGHRDGRTTQIYGQVPFEHTRLLVRGLVRKQIDDAKQRTP